MMKPNGKKIASAALALTMFAALLVGCGSNNQTTPPGNTPSTDDPTPVQPTEVALKSVDEVLASLSEDDKTCSSYQLDKYLTPYWESQVIYNESVIPYRDQDGKVLERSLMFPVAKVLEVRSNDLSTVYEEGKDYVVTEEGNLSFPTTTSIPVQNFDSIYLRDKTYSGFRSATYPDRYLQTANQIISMQIYVTYIRTEAFDKDLVPVYGEDALSTTIGKLKAKQEVSIVLYGDSISTGNASSSYLSMAPAAPIFSELIQERLRELYGYDGITVHNCATGGWTATDGKNNLSRVYSRSPDLVLLAFGMNDGGGAKTNAAANGFYANYVYMMEKIWLQFPQCEFIEITSILPNPDALDGGGSPALSNHKDFLPVARQIAEEYENEKVLVCDVLSIHEMMLKRKLFIDMGDGYNHPSDFVARLYAQAVCANLYRGD